MARGPKRLQNQPAQLGHADLEVHGMFESWIWAVFITSAGEDTGCVFRISLINRGDNWQLVINIRAERPHTG